jgi:hypothetical protein
MYLKVHKNEIFFGFDFEFCAISLIVMRSLKTKRSKKNFKKGQIFFYISNHI